MKCTTDKSPCLSRCLKIGLMAAVGVAAVTWVVMQLWNCLLPELFSGVSPIGYWQALGLLVLCRLLFGGRGWHGHWRGHRAHRESLTPEEREQFKSHFNGRWACCGSKDNTGTTAAATDSAGQPADKA